MLKILFLFCFSVFCQYVFVDAITKTTSKTWRLIACCVWVAPFVLIGFEGGRFLDWATVVVAYILQAAWPLILKGLRKLWWRFLFWDKMGVTYWLTPRHKCKVVGVLSNGKYAVISALHPYTNYTESPQRLTEVYKVNPSDLENLPSIQKWRWNGDGQVEKSSC